MTVCRGALVCLYTFDRAHCSHSLVHRVISRRMSHHTTSREISLIPALTPGCEVEWKCRNTAKRMDLGMTGLNLP